MPTFLNGREDKWKLFHKSKVILPSHNIFLSSSFLPFNCACTQAPTQHLILVHETLYPELEAPTRMRQSHKSRRHKSLNGGRITKKAIIIQCGRKRWCGRSRDKGITGSSENMRARKPEQVDKVVRTLTEEVIPELSHEKENVFGHTNLQFGNTHTCANLTFD